MPDFDTYAPFSPIGLLDGGVKQDAGPNPIRCSIDRRAATTDVAAALTTAVMLSVAVPLQAGDVVSKIAVQFGATAADTPANWWFALYSSASTPALLAQTADQTTGAIAANATKDLSLATAQYISTTGVYYVGIMVKATTVPSVLCSVLSTVAQSTGQISGQKQLARTSGSALTTTAPSTITSVTASVNVPLVVVH